MPRKAATPIKPEASLPETLIPLSEVPEHQRSAYELELIDNSEEFRKAVSGEDFFQMIQNFPQAWWGERLSMYLYRHEDDGGLMVKNADGEGKYIKPVIRQPVDRDWVANRNGGGKFQLWLNLSELGTRKQTTVRKHTFRLDGPPIIKEGQTVEMNGKPVSVGAAPAAPAAEGNDIAKVIDAASQANESSMKILAHASETAIDMVKAQAVTASAPTKDPIELAIQLVALLRQPAPVADPVQAKLMEKIIEKAFAPAAAPEIERTDTPLEQTIDLAEKLTGKSFPDLMKGKSSGGGDNEWGWVQPVANAAINFFQILPNLLAQTNAARAQEFERQVYLRSITSGQPAPPIPARLAAPAIQAPPNNVATMPPQNQPPDPAQLTNLIIDRIVRVFHKDPRSGLECAASIALDFADQLEAFGIERMLADPKAVDEFVDGVPALTELKADARWPDFRNDFLAYTTDRWGEPVGNEGEKKQGPQTVA